jgi:hypothetical protein
MRLGDFLRPVLECGIDDGLLQPSSTAFLNRHPCAVRTYPIRDTFCAGSVISEIVLGPLQSERALRLYRPLRRRHAVHGLCARPECARTDAQQRPWRKVHRGQASGAARVSGSVPVGGEGAGTRARGEAAYSRAEGRVGRQREATPQLTSASRSNREACCGVVHARSPDNQLATAPSGTDLHPLPVPRVYSRYRWL